MSIIPYVTCPSGLMTASVRILAQLSGFTYNSVFLHQFDVGAHYLWSDFLRQLSILCLRIVINFVFSAGDERHELCLIGPFSLVHDKLISFFTNVLWWLPITSIAVCLKIHLIIGFLTHSLPSLVSPHPNEIEDNPYFLPWTLKPISYVDPTTIVLLPLSHFLNVPFMPQNSQSASTLIFSAAPRYVKQSKHYPPLLFAWSHYGSCVNYPRIADSFPWHTRCEWIRIFVGVWRFPAYQH